MGPRRKSYNYGTFIASPGQGAEEEYGGNTASSYQRLLSAPAPAFSVHHDQEYRIALREDGIFGLRLTKHGGEVVISEMDDDVARVRMHTASQIYLSREQTQLQPSCAHKPRALPRAGSSIEDVRSRTCDTHLCTIRVVALLDIWFLIACEESSTKPNAARIGSCLCRYLKEHRLKIPSKMRAPGCMYMQTRIGPAGVLRTCMLFVRLRYSRSAGLVIIFLVHDVKDRTRARARLAPENRVQQQQPFDVSQGGPK